MDINNVKTVRELANLFPRLWDFDYKWKDSENFRSLSKVLGDYGFQLTKEDEDCEGDYNDLRGYLNCSIERCI